MGPAKGSSQGAQNRRATPKPATLRISLRHGAFALPLRKQTVPLCLADAEAVTLAEEGAGVITLTAIQLPCEPGSRTPRPRSVPNWSACMLRRASTEPWTAPG